jgi:hypothetical protein
MLSQSAIKDEVKPGEGIIFGSITPQTSMRARFKGLPGRSRFVSPCLAQNVSKQHLKPVEKPCQTGPNSTCEAFYFFRRVQQQINYLSTALSQIN